jgi:O-antigen/teichoic acid export membrane protein
MFVAMVLIARILGKEAFGEFGFIRSTAMTFVAFSSIGMGMTATKYIAELRQIDEERTGRIICLTYVFIFFTSLLVAIIFYLISPWLCETQLGKPELTHVMQLGSVLLFLMTFMGTQIAVLNGFQEFCGFAIVTIIVGIISLPIYVCGAYWLGMMGSVLAAILCVIVNILMNSFFIYKNTRNCKICYEFFHCYKELSILWSSSLPIVLCCILYSGMIWLVQMMLRMCPNGAVELGEFYAAQNIQTAFFFLPTVLSTVFFPNLCEVGGTIQNEQRYWSVVRKGLRLQLFISLILVLPMIIFPSFLMKLYGSEFIDNRLLIIMFGIWSVVNVLCSTIYQVMIDQKKVWIVVCFGLGEIILSLTATCFLLEKQWGNIGIVTSLLIGRIFMLTMTFFYLRRHTKRERHCC